MQFTIITVFLSSERLNLNVRHFILNLIKKIIIKIAEFLTSIGRYEEACIARMRATELSPNDYQLVTAAATALRILDRKDEAEKWYRQVKVSI